MRNFRAIFLRNGAISDKVMQEVNQIIIKLEQHV